MKTIITFLNLIRWPNLVMIILTQYAMRHLIIQPMIANMIERWHFDLQMSHLDFFLFVTATVMIAAAGYIINDYFDLKIDRVNRPEKIMVEKNIKRRVAMGAHAVINILALLIASYVCIKIGMWKLVFVFLFAVISLWFYSTHFKHQPLWGNLIIALLAGLIPLNVGITELPLLYKNYANIIFMHKITLNFLAYWIIAYSIFIFLITFVREITKDMVSMEGDKQFNSETIPVYWGIKWAKISANCITILLIVYVSLLHQYFLGDLFSMLYFIVLIILPLCFVIYKTYTGSVKRDFERASSINRFVSITAIGYTVVVWYIMMHGHIL